MFTRITGGAFGICALLAVTSSALAKPDKPPVKQIRVPLQVSAGTPLRLYLTKKVGYRTGASVQAKTAEPVWCFDRIVIPAGTIARGHVARLVPVPRMVRVSAMMGGNFTPLEHAEISFTELILPGGKDIAIQTLESAGLHRFYSPPRHQKRRHKASNHSEGAKAAYLHHLAKQQMNSQINARTYGLWGLVRSQNRREWLEEFLLNKLPYRPQWYRSGTLFNAVLTKNLQFGTIAVTRRYLDSIGTEPAPDSLAEMRILSTISSAHAHAGDTFHAVLAEPVFGARHQLILPQSTKITGKITLAHHARLLHRGGKLRFVIEDVRPPAIALPETTLAAAADPPAERAVQAQLAAVPADPKSLKVGVEGTAKATESKTRLLRPLVAALVAAKSMDNDTGKQTAAGGGSGNTGGLALGGFSGFGMLGMLVSRGPAGIGSALGFYGLAWSVYSNVVARGSEVTFPKNAELVIRFGSPPPK